MILDNLVQLPGDCFFNSKLRKKNYLRETMS